MSAQATVAMLVARTKNQPQCLTSYPKCNINFFCGAFGASLWHIHYKLQPLTLASHDAAEESFIMPLKTELI